MKRKIFIVSLSVILIAIILFVGYSFFQKSQKSKKTELSPNFQVSNYQIPAGQINTPLIQPAGITTSSSSKPATSQKSSGPIPSKPATSRKSSGPIPPQTAIPPVIGQNYLKFYNDSITNLNKISPAMNDVQKTLVAIQQKTQSGNDDDLSPLISEGNSQNAVLAADISALKNSLDSWLLANNQTTDAAIKSKTGETIATGKNFSQSSLDFSNAVSGILNYTGTGDPKQLSQQLQTAVQKVNDQGKTLVNLFTDINKLLSNL